ncbi:MAG: hypothetical protein JO364_07820 [Pseudonocardiales bacterium]|nr:hypothetical protein [Pseudonocardiales bacterium]MBV9030205.1 hypothetical protein [Pseudonocardiales bacterium]
MGAEAESVLFGPQGPVHSGTGDQFNGLTFILDSHHRLVRVGRDPRTVEREHLYLLNQRFVEPHPYGKARELLARNRSVLLTGAPGSGRRATAQMLLYRLPPSAEVQIRELPDADTGGPSDGPVLDASEVDSGQRLLLDLSAKGEPYSAVVLEQLPSYRDVVRDRGAHLAVVLPNSWEHYLSSELGSPVVDIVRPNGREVFRRYLRFDDITRDAQLDVGELTELLCSESMERIAKLAGLVRFTKESEPRKEFQHWLSEAFAAWTKRSDEVAKQAKELRSAQQCALLLTSAMFSGAHADAIFDSASRLGQVIRYPADDRPRLEQEGLTEQLAEIGSRTDDAGRVRFTPLAYDRAVCTHFWTNYPDLRKDFRKWVGITLERLTLSSEDRDEVVTRFAEQALRTDRPEDLRLLAERWVRRTNSRWPSRLLPQAAKAVERGLNDERHDVFFRRQLYIWSVDPNLGPDLAQVVVQMCAEVLALTHPEQALVRLHHITRRHSGTAGEAARDALLKLIDRDRRLYRRLLDRVTDDLMTDIARDLPLFLELAAPDRLTRTPPLIADAAVRVQLSTGWTAVLGGLSLPGCAHPVRTWLAAAREDDRYRERLLTVLVEAGEGRWDLLSRLHVIARDWAHEPEGRQEERVSIADRLKNMIDSALGIDFAGLDLRDRTEGTSP